MNAILRRLSVSFRPALIHLSVSVLIALASMALIFLVWYPSPLDVAQGVSHLVLLMIGVDVMLGPLITCIIFSPAKKYLWVDLMTIAALQTIALLYGLHAIFDGRPAYLVFNVDRFDVVAAKELVMDSLARVPPGLGLSVLGPRTVAARLPAESEKRQAIMFSAASGGADLPQLPEFYVPIEGERSAMLRRLHPLKELRELQEIDDKHWQEMIEDIGVDASSLGYLPMRASAKDGAVFLDSQTGAILGIRMLTPRFDAPSRLEPSPSIPTSPIGEPSR